MKTNMQLGLPIGSYKLYIFLMSILFGYLFSLGYENNILYIHEIQNACFKLKQAYLYYYSQIGVTQYVMTT